MSREPEADPRTTSRFPASWWRRISAMRTEFVKFATVGGTTFCLDSGLLYVIDNTLHEPILAKTTAAVVAATAAFLGNRYWTWRHRPHSGLLREYGLYAVANGVGLAIQLTCLGIAHYGLGAIWPATFRTVLADLVAANVVGMAAATTFRFWSYRTFVFRQAEPGDPDRQAATGQATPGAPIPDTAA